MRDFTVLTFEQRSAEWIAARLGLITASRAADILATVRSGEAADRRNYRVQLLCEKLTGQPCEDGYTSPDMERGIALEPEAFAAYEALTGNMAEQVGFCKHNTYAAGCSPDGVVDSWRGLLELKAPRPATHWSYMRGDPVVPPKYMPQLWHSLWLTGAEFADFLSYCPAFPPHLRTFYVRYYRNDTEVSAYAAKALAFLDEVDREYQAALGWHAVEAAHV